MFSRLKGCISHAPMFTTIFLLLEISHKIFPFLSLSLQGLCLIIRNGPLTQMTKSKTEEIIMTYQDVLYRFACFRTGSTEDAQDIVQNVFLNMFRSERENSIINIKAYLYKSVLNACLNRNREKKTVDISQIPEQGTDKSGTMNMILLKEQYKTVESLLKQLPPEQAEVIRMRIIDELHFTEIAMLEGEPETTIKSRFKYGMEKLKRIVKSKDYYHEMF